MSQFAKEILTKRKHYTYYFDLKKLQVLSYHEADTEYNKTDFISYQRGLIKLGKLEFSLLRHDPQNPMQFFSIRFIGSELFLLDIEDCQLICHMLFDEDASKINNKLLVPALALVQILIKMALGEDINAKEFRVAWSQFVSAKNNLASKNDSLDAHEMPRQNPVLRDVDDFIADYNLKPTNPHEVSAKIAAYFYINQSINTYQISKIIRAFIQEYFTHDEHKLSDDQFKQFFSELSSLKIDAGKYSLDQLIPNLRKPNDKAVNISQLSHNDLIYPLRRQALAKNEAKNVFVDKSLYRTEFFDITSLMYCDDKDAQQKLYLAEDFAVPPRESGRNFVKAKLGKLYIEYCPGGKGSFMLSISIIDKHNKQLKPLFNYDGARHSHLDFESLVPLSLAAFYPSMTSVMTPMNEQKRVLLEKANAVKKLLITLALGGDVVPVDFYTHLSSLLSSMEKSAPDAMQIQAALDNNGANKGKTAAIENIQRTDQHQQNNDISAFMHNVSLLPQNINELAAKIAAYFYFTLGLSNNELKYLIYEYFNYNRIEIASLNIEKFVNDLLNTQIDQNRYPLKYIIPSDDATNLLLTTCNELKNYQLPKQIELPIALNTPALGFVKQKPIIAGVSGTVDANQSEPIKNNVINLTQNNPSSALIQTINNIVSTATFDKYTKHLTILGVLRSTPNLTANQIEELFEHLNTHCLALLNHHRNEYWDWVLGKTNTASFSSFVTDLQKIWLEKLTAEIELLPPYSKLFKLNLAKNSLLCNYQTGNYFNPPQTDFRRNIEEMIARVQSPAVVNSFKK